MSELIAENKRYLKAGRNRDPLCMGVVDGELCVNTTRARDGLCARCRRASKL